MKFSESLSNKDIKQKATIYKKETLRFLSEYQKLINSSTQEICLKNPSFLASRQKLLDVARSQVDSIYSFKKGRSRSKRQSAAAQPPTKRPKLTFDVRADHMKRLEEEIKNIKERISYKEKRTMAENVKKTTKVVMR